MGLRPMPTPPVPKAEHSNQPTCEEGGKVSLAGEAEHNACSVARVSLRQSRAEG
jgi:hypothetical protein